MPSWQPLSSRGTTYDLLSVLVGLCACDVCVHVMCVCACGVWCACDVCVMCVCVCVHVVCVCVWCACDVRVCVCRHSPRLSGHSECAQRASGRRRKSRFSTPSLARGRSSTSPRTLRYWLAWAGGVVSSACVPAGVPWKSPQHARPQWAGRRGHGLCS